jgi:hypothetical protein
MRKASSGDFLRAGRPRAVSWKLEIASGVPYPGGVIQPQGETRRSRPSIVVQELSTVLEELKAGNRTSSALFGP